MKYLFSGLILFSFHLSSGQTNWKVDQAHSSIQFEVTHMVVSTVTGTFKKFSGTLIQPDESFENASLIAEIEVGSIDTGNAQRDNHLKAPDFFNTSEHPVMKFESTSFKRESSTSYTITGNLTLCGVTKPVVLKATYGGSITNQGRTKAGFKATGSLNRFDYGLKWNGLMEAGGAMVGDTVDFTLNIELNRV